jgi:hypothetical protein
MAFLQRPASRTSFEKKEQFRGEGSGGQRTSHCLKGFALGGRGIGVEADREGFNQGRSVGSLERVKPGVALTDLSTGQPDPDRTIQPAGAFRQGSQQRLAQQEAFPRGGYRPKPQFASLISPMQDDSPGKDRPFVPIPV